MAMSSLSRFVLAACAALFLCSGAHAAPTISGNYYDEGTFATCNTTSICKALFSPIPAGRKVLITQISCDIQAAGNDAEIRGVSLGIQAGSQFVRSKVILPNLIYTAAGNAQRTYVVSQPIQLLVAVNRPAVSTFFSTNADAINLFCQITGTISPP